MSDEDMKHLRKVEAKKAKEDKRRMKLWKKRKARRGRSAKQAGKKQVKAQQKAAVKQYRKAEAKGQLKALGREAVKDVRGTLMQFFFHQPEHSSEPGTPLNPTQELISDQLKDRGTLHHAEDRQQERQRSRGR